jgi:hypothetical protein
VYGRDSFKKLLFNEKLLTEYSLDFFPVTQAISVFPITSAILASSKQQVLVNESPISFIFDTAAHYATCKHNFSVFLIKILRSSYFGVTLNKCVFQYIFVFMSNKVNITFMFTM